MDTPPPQGSPRESLDAYARFAARLADGAGAILREHFRRPVAVERKADGSPVTAADRAAEAAMRALITAQYPAHGVVGEEGGIDFERFFAGLHSVGYDGFVTTHQPAMEGITVEELARTMFERLEKLM